MPTVDDLVISVRIDETSNLGKLQKQLTALVGPKGDKAVEIGIDPILKRDLQIIKDRIVKFTPSVLVDENLKEAALNLASDLKKDENLRDVLLQRYGINIDKYETFIEELFNIAIGISDQNSDQQKGFIAEMDKFRKLAMMNKGQRETLIKRLTRMMLESGFHKKVVELLREAGVKLISKPPIFELTKGSIGKAFEGIIEKFREKDPERFAELQAIFEETSDTLKATGEAYEKQTGKILDITELTQNEIEKNADLQMVIVAQIAAAIKKSNWMLEQFYKAGKELFTAGKAFAVSGPAQLDTIVHRFSPDALKQLGIEHVVGDKIDDSMVNFMAEFKTVAGKADIDYEETKRIVKQGYDTLFFIVEEYTSEAVNRIEELKRKEEYKNKKIGLYRLLPRAVEKLLGIEKDLDDLEKEAKDILKIEEDEGLTEEDKEFLKALEETEAELRDEIEDVEKEATGKKAEEGALSEKNIDNVLDSLDDIKAVTDDTNKEVKKKDDEPKVEKTED